MSLLLAAAFGLFVALSLVLVRVFTGPTLYDRVLGINTVGTKIVLLLALVGFIMGRPDFLDIAILYALINFVSTIAILKFFRYRSFQVSLTSRNRSGGVR